MGDDRVSRQIEGFLDYMHEIMGLEKKDDGALICNILSSYISPIEPVRGNFIPISNSESGIGVFVCCSFRSVNGDKGFYVSTRLRQLGSDDLRSMKSYNRAVQRAFGCQYELNLVEPINTLILFHILLNAFIERLPVIDGKVCAPAKTKKSMGISDAKGNN